MDKYAQMKSFHLHRVLQVYMYAFINVDTDTMTVEEIFHAKNVFAVNYKKI